MSQRSFLFEPPLWKTPARSRAGAYFPLLIITSIGWAALYAWLGWLLWTEGIGVWQPLHTLLLVASIALGVVVVLGWRTMFAGTLRNRRRWKPMNLEELQALEPGDFEEYVARRLFSYQGYQADNTRNTKDGGIDVMVTDRFGQKAVVQCKRYRGTVGAAVVRELYGTMMHAGATYAYLVTTGSISDEARQWAIGKPIELIDGVSLVELTKSDGIL